jgi:8-oxo-dGTP pyrophosphatase MutT (NUDIX family)
VPHLCISFGNPSRLGVWVIQKKLTFRPSVYAIIVDNGKVLLLNTRHTGTYSLPGGGVDLGETLEVALKREVRGETGLEIEVVRFHRFEEQFFYYPDRPDAYDQSAAQLAWERTVSFLRNTLA